MIAPEWRRICGFHVEQNGDMAAVWLAHDKDADCVHLYDACQFRDVVFAVVAEGLNARGRFIPISWRKEDKDVVDELRERGCKVMTDGIQSSDAMVEVVSREMVERQQTGRFKTDVRLKNWIDEFKTFYREDAKVPQEGYPLMSATRHAITNLKRAKAQSRDKINRKDKFRRVAMI